MNKRYYIEHRQDVLDKNKVWRDLHPEKMRTYKKNWENRNPEKVKENRERFQSTEHFRIAQNARRYIRRALVGKVKKFNSKSLIGCSVEELKVYLMKTAPKNFTWDHYKEGLYSVDHIIPMCSFNLLCGYHKKICFNHSNLQILKNVDNIRKNSKLIGGYHESY